MKKIQAVVKLQIPAGKANPSPPVGPALGQHGVNIMEFCKGFNAQTGSQDGLILPVVVTIFADRSFTFIVKTPPAAVLLKRAAGIAKASAVPHKDKIGKVTRQQVRDIAQTKLVDLNTDSIDAAMRIIEGTARGIGKTVRVAVFAKGEKEREAREAGADVIGAEDLVERVQGGWMEFDTAIATPDLMGQVGRLGKVLGPRGLMPNPKLGTVTFDVNRAVREAKAGKVEFRVDKAGNVHTPIGKHSFGVEQLAANGMALIEAIVRAKPAAAKGTYLRSLTVSTTMGPGVPVDAHAVAKALHTFARTHQALAIKAGYVEGQMLPPTELKALADLPSREALRAYLVGTIQGVLARLVGLLTAPQGDLVYILQQRGISSDR